MVETEVKPFSGVDQKETKTTIDNYEKKGKEDIKKLHSKPITTKSEDIKELETVDKRLLSLLLKRLKKLLESADITLEDIERLQRTSEVIKEKKQKMDELEEKIKKIRGEIEREKEKIGDIIYTLRENESLRLTLISLDLLDEEALKLIIGEIYNPRKTQKGGKKYVEFESLRFDSITAFLKFLKKKGLIELPNSKYNPKRYLESWVNQNGYTIREEGDIIFIEKPKAKEEPQKEEDNKPKEDNKA